MSGGKPDPKGPITKKEIQEFINSSSDFGLEIKVRRIISSLGIVPLHSGIYSDPITDVAREYDFRFSYKRDNLILHAAVECKNISEFSPVLVSCLPRTEKEAKLRLFRVESKKSRLHKWFKPLDVHSPSRYPQNESCGKSVSQITRKKQGQGFSGADSEIYSKWSQAISSLIDFSGEKRDLPTGSDDDEIHVFIPFVVIPDGNLWQVVYDESGNITSPLNQVERTNVFINRVFEPYGSSPPLAMDLVLPSMRISHIEFMTLTGFQEFIASLKGDESYLYELCAMNSAD